MIAVDSSITSYFALEWARNNVFRPGDIIVELCVWESTNAFGDNEDNDGTVKYNEAKNLVKNLYSRLLTPYNYSPYTILLTTNNQSSDSIANTISRAVHQIDPDLLVMGSRGLHKQSENFQYSNKNDENMELGSVSGKVSKNVICPIMIVTHNPIKNNENDVVM